MTASSDLYLHHAIAGGGGEGSAGARALWWPPTKIAAPRLARYLFGAEEAERMRRAGTTELPGASTPIPEHRRHRRVTS
jgi:hypothetical protein